MVKCLSYMRENGLTRIEATDEAQRAWTEHAEEVAAGTLFAEADSCYMGANIPEKARQLIAYAGGLPVYFNKCNEVAANGYEGFALR